MRQDLNEIKEIFHSHNYDVNTILQKNIKKFKLKFAFLKYGIQKNQGFDVLEIVTLLLILPLLALRSIHHLYCSHYNKIANMHKDTLYRLKNNCDIDWRRILYHTAKTFDTLSLTRNNTQENSALILDDTTLLKTGTSIEKVSYVFDHVLRKSVLGFKNLTCAHFDGVSYKVVDFSLHSEKELSKAKLKKQYRTKCDKRSQLSKRLHECSTDKIQNGINMLKRAAKNGIQCQYVITDAWFACEDTLKAVRALKNGTVHFLSACRKDNRKYNYDGKLLNANELLQILKDKDSVKRNRSHRLMYCEALVEYKGVKLRVYFSKGTHQRHWKLFWSSNTTLTFNKFCESYAIRWGIEIVFKECKTYLKLGKCQSQSFAAQIAEISLCYMLYNMLIYEKRSGEYKTTGTLFEYFSEQLREQTLAEKIWNMLLELLEFIVDKITFEQCCIDSYSQLEKHPLFENVKKLMEGSFLSTFFQSAQ